MSGRARALRVLLVANDGLSAGHVTRAVAVARALGRAAATRSIELATLLLTTSEVRAIGDGDAIAVARLPSPRAGQRGGLGERERQRVVERAAAAIADAFAPDLLVVDTFPSGPHGELAGLDASRSTKRAIVRRRIRAERAGDPAVTRGLERYDLAIVADDPDRDDELCLPIRAVHVPPITLGEAVDAAARDDARARLGVAAGARAVLVTAGGGGDADGVARAAHLAEMIASLDRDAVAVLAPGPLARAPIRAAGFVCARETPLAPWLAAFDGAIAAAGYNTSHELAKAGVPAALFAEARPFDDQAARVARFAARGLAVALEGDDAPAVERALAWMRDAPRPRLPAGGADRAAEALLDLACGSAA